jgi:hypothetical protein
MRSWELKALQTKKYAHCVLASTLGLLACLILLLGCSGSTNEPTPALSPISASALEPVPNALGYWQIEVEKGLAINGTAYITRELRDENGRVLESQEYTMPITVGLLTGDTVGVEMPWTGWYSEITGTVCEYGRVMILATDQTGHRFDKSAVLYSDFDTPIDPGPDGFYLIQTRSIYKYYMPIVRQ